VTISSRLVAISETCDLDSDVIPNVSTRPSTRRVETPRT
jgi:hypothetical protein